MYAILSDRSLGEGSLNSGAVSEIRAVLVVTASDMPWKRAENGLVQFASINSLVYSRRLSSVAAVSLLAIRMKTRCKFKN